MTTEEITASPVSPKALTVDQVKAMVAKQSAAFQALSLAEAYPDLPLTVDVKALESIVSQVAESLLSVDGETLKAADVPATVQRGIAARGGEGAAEGGMRSAMTAATARVSVSALANER